jgi:hypothetical protein
MLAETDRPQDDGTPAAAPAPEQERRSYTARQFADRLGVSVQHVWGLIRSGQLEAVDITNRRRRRKGNGARKRPHRPTWRIPQDSARAFLGTAERSSVKRRPGRPRKRETSHLPAWE